MNQLGRLFKLADIFDRKVKILSKIAESNEENLSHEESIIGKKQVEVFEKVFELKDFILNTEQLGDENYYNLILRSPVEEENRFAQEALMAKELVTNIHKLIIDTENTIRQDPGKITVDNIYSLFLSKLFENINALRDSKLKWAKVNRNEYGYVFGFLLNKNTSLGAYGDETRVNYKKFQKIFDKIEIFKRTLNAISEKANEILNDLQSISKLGLVPEEESASLLNQKPLILGENVVTDAVPEAIDHIRMAGFFDPIATNMPEIMAAITYEHEEDFREKFKGMSTAELIRKVKNGIATSTRLLSKEAYLDAVFSVLPRIYKDVKLATILKAAMDSLSEESRHVVLSCGSVFGPNNHKTEGIRALTSRAKSFIVNNFPGTFEKINLLIGEREGDVDRVLFRAWDAAPKGFLNKKPVGVALERLDELNNRLRKIIPIIRSTNQRSSERIGGESIRDAGPEFIAEFAPQLTDPVSKIKPFAPTKSKPVTENYLFEKVLTTEEQRVAYESLDEEKKKEVLDGTISLEDAFADLGGIDVLEKPSSSIYANRFSDNPTSDSGAISWINQKYRSNAEDRKFLLDEWSSFPEEIKQKIYQGIISMEELLENPNKFLNK